MMSKTREPATSRTPDAPFAEIVADLEERNVIAIDGEIRKVLRRLYDATVGRYIQCRLDASGGTVDMWAVPEYQRFVFVYANIAVFKARQDAGGQPTPDQIWSTARALFPRVKDRYCERLQPCPEFIPKGETSPARFHGATCPTDIGGFSEP